MEGMLTKIPSVLILIGGYVMIVVANHAPQFPREINIINAREEEPIGTHLLSVAATDADGDMIEYSLAGANTDYLRIDHRSGEITTSRVIDRETIKILKFKVIASEVNRPQEKAVQDVVVHVLDKNDNIPIFDKSYYSVNVSEYTPRGVTIARVSASDKDGDELVYSITRGNELGFFDIDLYAGTITTEKKLDYEVQSQINLQVSVTDGREKDADRHTTITMVYIGIIDEDDNSAKFDRNYSVTIEEGRYQGEIIETVHAEDLDNGIKSAIRYSIDKSTNIGSHFRVNEKGHVSVHGLVDRENVSQYKLILIAEEVLKKPSVFKNKPGTAILTVDVTDIDDNKPVFVRQEYIGHVKEHEILDTVVLKVTALDADEGENAQFQYVLAEENGAFGVSQDGSIKVQKDLDREENYIYRFKVLARALTTKGEFSSCDVTIIVDDINDHRPVFSQTLYEANVKENAEKDTLVTQVMASDKDHQKYAEIRYNFIPDADGGSDNFKLDAKTGIILTKRKLDREEKSEYSLLVKATDTIGLLEERRVSRTKIKILILDENDNSPIFKRFDFFKNIHYDEPTNTPIAKVEATDLDANMFGRVRYRIVKGNDLKRFHINKVTGQVKVADDLAKFTGQFRLEIQAYDNLGQFPSKVSPTNTVVVVTVDKQGQNSVILVMWAKVPDVIANQQEIVKDLESMLRIGMIVDHIERGDSPDSTHFIVHGYNIETYAIVKKDNVIRSFYQTSTAAMRTFRTRWNITSWHAQKTSTEKAASENTKKSVKWQPIIWAILGFSALVAIVGMVGIIYLIKARRRRCGENNPSPVSTKAPMSSARSTQDYWNDKLESVSQGRPDSYIHSSGFLDIPCDKYDLDPSNLYNSSEGNLYEKDPFIEAERESDCSNNSRASSRFAASSVVTTVCRTPNHLIPPGKHRCKGKDRRSSQSDGKEKRLSIINDNDDDGNIVLSTMAATIRRPPSYEYDLDEKLTDKSPSTYFNQE